jgi:hypothetical protein
MSKRLQRLKAEFKELGEVELILRREVYLLLLLGKQVIQKLFSPLKIALMERVGRLLAQLIVSGPLFQLLAEFVVLPDPFLYLLPFLLQLNILQFQKFIQVRDCLRILCQKLLQTFGEFSQNARIDVAA